MIIGEAPGETEDRLGKPFVGVAGCRLNDLLGRANAQRGDFYVTNTVRCRPPNNGDPRMDEISACATYLRTEAMKVKPLLVLVLGRVALNGLFRLAPLHARRGRWLEAEGGWGDWGRTFFLPTWHPIRGPEAELERHVQAFVAVWRSTQQGENAEAAALRAIRRIAGEPPDPHPLRPVFR
jgi:uracil-DNA glycosylase family 4